MGHRVYTIIRRKIFCACVFFLTFSACAGQDLPYIVSSPSNSNPSGTLENPQTNSNLSGCAIPFDSQLVLQTKGGPGLGEIKSDPRKVNPIPLRFSGSQVALFAQEFPTIDLVIAGAPAAMRIQQKDGTSAQGSYDASSGEIEINNLVFIVTLLDPSTLNPMGLAPIEMPPLTLGTGSVNQSGSFGAIQVTGSKLDASSKKLTLVGGLAIPSSFPSSDLQGASLVVSFEGSISDLPSSGNCSGSFSSGVSFKEVASTPNGEIERDVSNNTLGFDRVYVPQVGVDVVSAGDTHFFSTKKLRVKNTTDTSVEANIQNTENFKITPQGSVTIAAGASKDFQVEFSAKAQSNYSEQNVPVSKEVSTSISFGSSALKLGGELKRAAPELVITGTENTATNSVDFNFVPAQITGSGANAKLDCKPAPGKKTYSVSRPVSIQNWGIRPLHISKINQGQDSVFQAHDPFCAGYPTEFLRINQSQQGTAQCKSIQQNGHTYIQDDCQLPDSKGKVNFNVLYYPVNASSIVNAVNNKPTPDTGFVTIASNDPRYDKSQGKEDFKLNLSGGVSPDQSNVLRLQKEGSTVQVNADGNIRINIDNNNDSSKTQKIFLLNYLDQPLNNVQISLEDGSQFEILQNPAPPTQVPGMPSGGSSPGKAEFTVKFTKKPGMTEGDVSTRLKIKFTPNGGVENNIGFNLIGSVNHKILTGHVNMKVDFISSYFDTNLLKSGPIDSEDFRSGKFDAFRPGDLELNFAEVPGEEGIRHVTMVQKLNIDPYNPNLVDAILNLTPEDRKKVLRVYSTRLSGYPGGPAGEDLNHDGIPDCTEPQDLRTPFQDSHCSFFYYVFATRPGQDGIYNDETGELFFPDVKLRLVNPYHAAPVADYPSTLITNTELRASITTHDIDGLTADSLPLVPDPRLSSSDIAVPDDLVKNLISSVDQQCPAGWVPWDASKKPVFSCFLRPSSPYYLRGFPARPLDGGQYSVVISMMSKLNPVGPPENVPSFMANGRMWVAIMGRLMPAP